MLRMFGRRMSQVDLTAGTDQVMFGISLPSDTVIHDIRAKVKVIGQTHAINVGRAVMYAVEGWILPVQDPDAALGYDVLWDTLVPKDTDVQTMDLDTGASDTSTFYEPGEADWTSIFDVGLRPERLYHRHRTLTIVDGAVFRFQDNQTPFLVKYAAGDTFQIHLRKRLRVRQPSVLVFAAASPALDDTTATLQAALAENEWGQVKYAGHMLERAMLHVLGLVEAGAETPWEEATALLQKHLDPDVYEEVGAQFASENYDVYTEAMVDHSVVGELGKMAVSTGR